MQRAPTPQNLVVEHFQRMDGVYRLQRHIYDFTRPLFLIGRDQLLDRLEIRDGDRVLEIGCGTGRNLFILARRYPNARFFGVDASQEMLKTAVRRHAGYFVQKNDTPGPSPIEFRHGLAENLSYQDTFGLEEPFDLIFFSYSLSMMVDGRLAFERALGSIKAGRPIHIVDFWDQKELPRWFQAFLKRWLSRFYVQHRPEFLDYLRSLEEQGYGSLSLEPCWRRYAYLAQFQVR